MDTLVAVGTRLPKTLVRRLKQIALDTDRSFQDVLIEALEQWLERREAAEKVGK